MEIEGLLNLNYNSLISYMSYESNKEYLLKDNRIKEKILCPYNKYDFINLASSDNDIIPYLFDKDGVKIIEENDYYEDKLNAILTSGKSYINKLFENENFLNSICKNFDKIKHYLYEIDNDLANKLYNYVEDDKKAYIITNVSNKSKAYIIENNNIDKDLLWQIILYLDKDSIKILFDKLDYKVSLASLSIEDLYKLSTKEATFPPYIFDDKNLISKLSKNYDIIYSRFTINSYEGYNNLDSVKKSKRLFLENEINSIKNDFTSKYASLYMIITYLKDKNMLDYNKIKQSIYEIFASESKVFRSKLLTNIINLVSSDDLSNLKEFLKNESEKIISNLIIDVSFEDVYINVLKDVNELITYNLNGEKTLSKEDFKLYSDIYNIEKLSLEEKIALYEKIKNINMVEKFYDDMRNAKNKMYESLNNAILNKQNIGKFKNDELSKKYGVNIYFLEGDPYYVLVKSVNSYKEYNVLDYQKLLSYKDGASFSIDSGYKLNTFLDPKICYNLAYEGFDIAQVVHAYPEDSYSNYSRKDSMVSTNINKLMNPYDFVTNNRSYNEIVIAQKNINKPTDMDSSINILKPFAIYCYDEINENDIISAKNLGLDIIVVNTRKYDPFIVNQSKDDKDVFHRFSDYEYAFEPQNVYR